MIIELKTEDEIRVTIFKALADPVRLEFVRTMHHSDRELSCGEIAERWNVSKSNTSYHFRTLREAGLIRVRKEGQTKYTTIQRETFDNYLPGFLETL